MKRLMIRADATLLERARARAAERGVSVASVVRAALERELGHTDPPPEIRCAGAFDSGGGELARLATRDHYVARPFGS